METVEVVIRIPKELYINVLNSWEKIHPKLYKALKNGTILPKGHGDLIDRKSISYENTCVIWNAEQGDILECNAPTIIEADKGSEDSAKIDCSKTKCENCTNHNYCDFEPQESEG